MPIQTAGHQVQVMPQYTALDPNRVTFDPTGFGRGALSGIEIIDQLARQRAFAQQQAELAATREGRLGAMNAQNLATIQLAPQRNIADIALAQQQAALIPGQTQLGLNQNQAALADLALRESLRGYTDDTARTKAQVENAILPKQADATLRKLDEEAETAPQEQQLKLAKLSQDIESIANDKAMSDAQKLATIRNLNASALQSEAAARRSDREEPKKVDPIKELSELQLEIQRLQSTPVINPGADNMGTPMPILQYEAQTRAPDGSVVQIDRPGFWNFGQMPAPLNPEAERVREQLKILQDRRDTLTRALVSQPSAPSSAPSGSSQSKPAAPKEVKTQAEFNSLPSGAPFIWNGRQGIKK